MASPVDIQIDQCAPENNHDDNLPERAKNDNKLLCKHGFQRWLVVLGCFMCYVIVGGLDRSDGIFYLKFLDKFGASAQATSWAVSLAGTLRLCLGPLSSTISDRFSGRVTVIIGGILLCASFLGVGFSPNLIFVYITFGIVGGFGRSFVYAPSLVLVGQYFFAKPGLPVGIATSGTSVGTIVIPPLVYMLFEEFNFWGVFLILSAVGLNCCAFGGLLRPCNKVKKRKQSFRQNTSQINKHPVKLISLKQNVSEEIKIVHKNETRRRSGSFQENCRANPAQTESVTDDSGQTRHHNKQVDRGVSVYSSDTLSQQREGCNEHRNWDHPGHTNKTSKYINISLLRNPSFVMYLVSVFFFTSGFKTGYTFLPALAQSHGCSEADSTYLILVAGIVDTLGRIVLGFTFDLRAIRMLRPFLFSIISLSLSGTFVLFPFMTGFLQFAVVSGLFGLLTGAYISQKSVILVDILDVQKLSSSFGLLLLSQGLGSLLGPPLAGFLKDVFDDYDKAFYLGAALMAGAAAVMVLSNIFMVAQRRKLQQDVEIH